MDKVVEFIGSPWNVEAVEKLRQLWREGVPASLVSQALGRPESQVRAKAAELSLPQHVESRG